MIGIRHEDKSRWEGRVPLVPADLLDLRQQHGIDFHVQTSPIRAFPDRAYAEIGATIVDDLDPCPIIMGVKEIPPDKIAPQKVYLYFSHVIKGQPANMPALRRLIDAGCTLIDYERIVDENNRRLVFFGRFAGLAGMIDTLWALGQRLQHEGLNTPFAEVRPAHAYDDLDHAKLEISRIGQLIRKNGLPESLRPFIVGFAGYGHTSQGAQEIFDLLPVHTIEPDQLSSCGPMDGQCCKVVFREEHLVELKNNAPHPFDLHDYYTQPQKYQAKFFPALKHLTVLMNCIYWEPKYPRLVTRANLQELFDAAQRPRLRVFGDITCDIDGSLECTRKATTPDAPVYVYDVPTGKTVDGVAGNGPVVLAVDFLPCELPVDASNYFSRTLRPFIPALATADFNAPLSNSGLPPELQRATIVYRGQLTENYQYLASCLA